MLVMILSLLGSAGGRETPPGNLTDLSACKVSHLGLEYLGDVQKTESGVRCQAWSSNTPHKIPADLVDGMFPDGSRKNAKNYCRNPTKDPSGPWCYTMNTDLKFETCALPLCSFSTCRISGPGAEYSGKHNKAVSDKNCLKWNKNRSKVKESGKFLSYAKFDKIKFPEGDLGKARKNCRNPDGDSGGPWCFVENEDTDEIEREYCDIPFCDEPDCEVFTKNFNTYTHYTDFNETLTNFSFGLKLWNSDSFLNASAKLVLTSLPLPLTGKEIQDVGVGLEIFISNKESALRFGNKDKKVYYEDTSGILKSTKFTMFSLTWASPLISLFVEGELKPIFLAEYRTKNNLLGFKKNKFSSYTAQGTDLLWYFPFCMDDFECDVHTTTGPFYQQFRPLRVNNVGQDLQFYLRAFHSVNIIFVASPTSDYPNVIISLERSKQLTRVTANLSNTSSVILKELSLPNLLDYWEWREFSVGFFADTLQFYWTKSVGASLIFELRHDVFRRMRWFSSSSDLTVAHWTFFCSPPEIATPPSAFPPECALDREERDYKGTQDVTSDGYVCLPWSGTKLLPNEAVYETRTTLKALNYCRDPLQENKGTYCYVITSMAEKKAEKRFCRLRKCKSQECRMAGTGNDYIGSVNVTRSNRSCEFWFSKRPLHSIDKNYRNITLYADLNPEQDALNYCRNPSRDFAGQKREGSRSISMVYRSMWKVTKGKKVEVAMKVLKEESCDKYLKSFLDLAGQYAFLQSAAIVRLFGITLNRNVSMVLEYFRLGPLDHYLKENRGILKPVDLIEASSNLASALWHLKENNIVHGNIRCRKLMVNTHDENSFTVKLTDPGIHVSYASKEVHWIPVECYANLDFARHSTAADVWAFATTLWEIFTFGAEIKSTDHIESMRLYASGKRLPQPTVCPNDIFHLMRECWEADPHRRKQPQAVMRDVNQILYQVYNSRRTHSYAKVFTKSNSALQNVAGASTNSLYSNSTEATFVPYSDDLVPASEISAPSSIRSESESWITNSQELVNNEDSLSNTFSHVLSNFNFSSTATTSLDSINSMQTIFEIDDDCNVVLQGRIGQGFYGEVYRGTLEFWEEEPRKVAVKKLKATALSSGLQDFEREINIMKTLIHPNIVEILGVLREPEICLVMEYVQHGSLQSYLKIYRESLHHKQLLKYALDIANGMHYLGTKNIVHRDLAARNILVVDESRVKISDFGLAQVMGTNDYYILRTNRELPIKWYAPESLRDGKFSARSDVWSYGVTMCEMFNCGEEPQLANAEDKSVGQEQQMLLKALESGARFPCPGMCPQGVYIRIVYPCWQANPHDRPRFADLIVETEDLLTQY